MCALAMAWDHSWDYLRGKINGCIPVFLNAERYTNQGYVKAEPPGSAGNE